MDDESMAGAEWRMATRELLRFVTEKMIAARREYAEFLAGVAELISRGAAAELGYGSPEKLVADLACASRTEAKRTVARAAALHDTRSVTGVQAAPLRATAVAVAEGSVSMEHVDRIRRFHHDLPATVDRESWQAAETALADIARTVPPAGLDRPIAELRARLDQDGQEPTDVELAHPQRELHTQWRGERFLFAGSLDREAGMLVEAALSPFTTPRATVEGDADPRTTPERHGDALVELVDTAARAGALPADGGGAVTILLTMDEQRLREGIGAATTVDGHSVPVAQVRRMACDAGVIPTVLGRAGEVLDMGSRSRTAPASVRNRLIARDGGCAFPGCTRPPAHCEAHHIRHWSDGGPTVPENMALLCRHHHRLAHHTQWEIRMTADGIPEFIPPPYLDPHRTPRRQPRLRHAA